MKLMNSHYLEQDFFEPFASKDEVENVQAASVDLVGI